MARPGTPKVHHYVPQFLPRGFACRTQGDEAYVFAFDKQTDRVFTANVRNIAAETGFNNAVVAEQKVSVEPIMAAMEAGVAPIIQRIIDNESLAVLTRQDRAMLSHFTAVQLIRTRGYREMLRQAHVGLAEAFRRRGTHPEDLGYEEPSEDMLAAQQIRASLL